MKNLGPFERLTLTAKRAADGERRAAGGTFIRHPGRGLGSAPPPSRPWWQKRRWWAAGLLWISLIYPVGAGPLNYCAARGWVYDQTYRAIYWPLRQPPGLTLARATGQWHWAEWWGDLGFEHRWVKERRAQARRLGLDRPQPR